MKCLRVFDYYNTMDENLHITPRHLDNLFIKIANQSLRIGKLAD